MRLDRRRMLALMAGAGISRGVNFRLSGAAASEFDEKLILAAEAPVLEPSRIPSPVVIDSIELLRRGGDEFVRVRSKDGAEGVSVTNSRGRILAPILNELIVPYFLGKDARALETHLWEVYRYQSNYKMQGLAFWCPIAWVEFAILDMLGRITHQSIGQLLGPIVRREVPYYVASGRRDTTPEEELEHLQRLLAESQARAVKFRVGGRMSRNQDASPGRTERLIPLARKILGDEIDLHADSKVRLSSRKDPASAFETRPGYCEAKNGPKNEPVPGGPGTLTLRKDCVQNTDQNDQ